MFQILFYENAKGHSELYETLIELSRKAETNKNIRIQLKQITLYIELLATHGTQLSPNIAKHICNQLWELRPGRNRILYFMFNGDKYVLLHMFQKKTQKTPKSEIEKAFKEINDFESRNGAKV